MNSKPLFPRLEPLWRRRSFGALLLLLLCAPLVLNYATPISNPDSALYLAEGLNLAVKGEYTALGSEPDILRPPLMPLLIAFAYQLLGASEQAALLVVKLFGLAAVIAFYATGERFFGRFSGFVTGVLIATSPYLTFYLFGTVMLDGPQAAMLGVFLYFLLSGLQTGRPASYLAAGFALAAGFGIKESAILWGLLPLLALLLIAEVRTWRTLAGLGVLYTPFLLAAAAWWLYVYQVSGTIYLVSSGRTLVVRSELLNLANPLVLGAGGVVLAAVALAVLLLVKTSAMQRLRNPQLWQRAAPILGGLLLLAYLAAVGSIPPAGQVTRYYTTFIRDILLKNPVWYAIVPAWLIFAVAFRRSTSARVLLIFLVLNLPLIAVLLTWQNQPRNLLPLFMVSLLVVAAVVVGGLRRLVQAAAVLHPTARLPVAASITALALLGLAILVWNSQIGVSLIRRHEDAQLVITGAKCARWIGGHAPAGSRVAITALYDEALYFLMGGAHFDVLPIYPTNSFFEFGPHGQLFADDNLYVAVRQSPAPGQRPYRYLDEDQWLAMLRAHGTDFYLYEGTASNSVGSFAAHAYYNLHPALTLVCVESGSNVTTAVYQVDQSKLAGMGITLTDPQALAALQADAAAQEEPLAAAALYDALGERIQLASAAPAQLAAGYQQIADAYWQAGRAEAALPYATRAAVLDPAAVDPTQTAVLWEYWTATQTNDGWSAVALADAHAEAGDQAGSDAAYALAVANLNHDPDLFTVLDARLANRGATALRIALNEQAAAHWPANTALLATLLSLHLASGDQSAAQKIAEQWLADQGDAVDAYLQLAQVYWGQQDIHAARQTLQYAHARWPQSVDVILKWAELSAAQEDYQGAIQLLSASLADMAADDRVYAKLIELYITLGKLDAAQQLLAAWRSASPLKFSALTRLGALQLQAAILPDQQPDTDGP